MKHDINFLIFCTYFTTDWCKERELSPDFELLEKEEMASILRQFYGEVRKQDGTEYSKNALQGIRSAIHRHIASAPWHRNFNIFKDSEFKAGNNVFLGSLKVNKRGGKNKTKSFSAISPDDMRKLMESGVLSTGSPEGLQNLVCSHFSFTSVEGVANFLKYIL